jgi:CBS domain-containing protein
MNTPVSTLLKKKGEWVISIHPDATVYETISRMVEHNTGAVVVTRGGELVGIFTERDYLRRIVLEGRTSKTTEVQEVMTREVVCATPDHTISECMTMMTEKKCRHLPVLRDGHLAGIISMGDCVKCLLDASSEQVEQLHQFIKGGYPG